MFAPIFMKVKIVYLESILTVLQYDNEFQLSFLRWKNLIAG